MLQLGSRFIDSSLTLVHASAAAYAFRPTEYPMWPMLGLDRVATFPMEEFRVDDLGATAGFVACNDEHLVIAFRGTDDVLDLAINLSASQTPNLEYYEGAVHRGFAQAVEGIWLELRTLVDAFRSNQQQIWLTGHSLGGALATLAAKRLDAFLGPVTCITFGQPRVGSPTFHQNYSVSHHRFVNEQDLVNKLPPRSLFTRYLHVGQELLLDAAGNQHLGEGDTSLLEDLFFGRLAKTFDLRNAMHENYLNDLVQRGLKDHRIATYVHRVDKLAATME